jgi:hypothetical protein
LIVGKGVGIHVFELSGTGGADIMILDPTAMVSHCCRELFAYLATRICSIGVVHRGMWLRIARQRLNCNSLRRRGVLFRHSHRGMTESDVKDLQDRVRFTLDGRRELISARGDVYWGFCPVPAAHVRPELTSQRLSSAQGASRPGTVCYE